MLYTWTDILQIFYIYDFWDENCDDEKRLCIVNNGYNRGEGP